MREHEDEVESQRWNEVMGGNEEIRHAMRGWEGRVIEKFGAPPTHYWSRNISPNTCFLLQVIELSPWWQ